MPLRFSRAGPGRGERSPLSGKDTASGCSIEAPPGAHDAAGWSKKETATGRSFELLRRRRRVRKQRSPRVKSSLYRHLKQSGSVMAPGNRSYATG